MNDLSDPRHQAKLRALETKASLDEEQEGSGIRLDTKPAQQAAKQGKHLF